MKKNIVKNPKHDWSEFQKNVFKNIAKGTGHTLIIARAGSSKTTVIVEGVKYIPKSKRVLFCAFNKSIQLELSQKLSSFVVCSTLHSLGLRALKNRFKNIEINNNKCYDIVETFFSDPRKEYDLIDNICKTISACKATLTDAPSKIEQLIIDKGIDICDIKVEQFIKYVIDGLRLCKEQTHHVDFDDMIWMCFVHRIKPEKYHYVFCDEGHDLSKAQVELALSALEPIDGRFFMMIDNFQCIYSFANADVNMLENMRKRLNPTELYLPICYRCPKKVVELAKNIVPDIQAFDKSEDGEIIHITYNELLKTIKPGSYLLSRFNAPLIKWTLILLKNNIPANILGRDIGDNLLYLIKKSSKKTVPDFLKWLDNWAKSEKEKIVAKNPKSNVDFISDKVECLYNLSDGAESIEDIKDNIGHLFKENDQRKIVLASSIHRIKGSEQNDVFLLEDTLRYPLDMPKNDDMDFFNTESFISYVAISRTKKRLFLVNKDKPNNIES